MVPDHLYACLRRDEVWHVHRSRYRLREVRHEGGQAFTSERGGRIEIQACDDFGPRLTDRFTAPAEILQMLRDCWPDGQDKLRDAIRIDDGRVRIRSMVRYVENDERCHVSSTTLATIVTRSGLSITTDRLNLERHLQLLRPITPSPSLRRGEGEYCRYPMLWRNGSGAVLLHEAIGHPAEQSIFGSWPAWLNVVDGDASSVDDVGNVVNPSVLTAGQAPTAFRREDFRSPPLRRMTSLVVSSSGAPAELPDPRIEVLLLRGGDYDHLHDSVRLSIALARLIRGGVAQPLQPFQFEEQRAEISRRMIGATGDPLPYPGVICADEGQRLPVGAVAPDLLTDSFS